jgi:hypothetical protein
MNLHVHQKHGISCSAEYHVLKETLITGIITGKYVGGGETKNKEIFSIDLYIAVHTSFEVTVLKW